MFQFLFRVGHRTGDFSQILEPIPLQNKHISTYKRPPRMRRPGYTAV